MIKKAEAAYGSLPPKIPEFLGDGPSGGKKRTKNSDGSSRTPFEPSWGICAQDSVLGNPALALDWSKCSITPPDMVHVSSGERILESEQLGAHALYQVFLVPWPLAFHF